MQNFLNKLALAVATSSPLAFILDGGYYPPAAPEYKKIGPEDAINFNAKIIAATASIAGAYYVRTSNFPPSVDNVLKLRMSKMIKQKAPNALCLLEAPPTYLLCSQTYDLADGLVFSGHSFHRYVWSSLAKVRNKGIIFDMGKGVDDVVAKESFLASQITEIKENFFLRPALFMAEILKSAEAVKLVEKIPVGEPIFLNVGPLGFSPSLYLDLCQKDRGVIIMNNHYIYNQCILQNGLSCFPETLTVYCSEIISQLRKLRELAF